MPGLLRMLSGGDRRSIGRSNEVVALVLDRPRLFKELFQGLSSQDPLVRMRAADATEKVSAEHPEWLRPYKRQLLGRVAATPQQEVRWHVAQMLPRLELTGRERSRAAEILMGYLGDESRIVKTFAMQALADLASGDARLRPRVVRMLEELTRTGSPAMKSRGWKLLAVLEKHRE